MIWTLAWTFVIGTDGSGSTGPLRRVKQRIANVVPTGAFEYARGSSSCAPAVPHKASNRTMVQWRPARGAPIVARMRWTIALILVAACASGPQWHKEGATKEATEAD